MTKDGNRAPRDFSQLVDGYPHWMLGVADSKRIRGAAPKRGRWVKILHGLRGVDGETAWRDVLETRGTGLAPDVVESDLEAVGDRIERYPDLGTLGGGIWKLFAAAVRECDLETRCFVWLEPYRMEPPQDACWLTVLDDVPAAVDVPENYYGGGPHAVWAVDESWFLVSDVDLPYSIVSCPDQLCDRLLSEPLMEALEVSGDEPLA